jgi:purine-nucleoside phosphorylase
VGKEKTPTVMMAGRAQYDLHEKYRWIQMLMRHSYYEGHELQTATFPIRVLALLGMKTLIGWFSNSLSQASTDILTVTNAAGGLNSTYKVGDVVVLHDV